MEELRAELSSAFIAAELGIPADIPQHASYIENSLRPLKQDKREIFGRRQTLRRSSIWSWEFIRDSAPTAAPIARMNLNPKSLSQRIYFCLRVRKWQHFRKDDSAFYPRSLSE
jgi:hypothetical protein